MTDIDYTGIICIPPQDKAIRYVLKKEGNNPLYVIGLNTSTADEQKHDPTVRNAMGIAAAKGYDGFVMFNLYPLRSTDPLELPAADEQKLVDKNIAAIQKELGNASKPTILAAWGTHIDDRAYLRESLRKIVKLPAAQGAKWKHYGDLTKEGHPRHLSPQSLAQINNDAELLEFDVEKYIGTLK